MHMLKFIPRPHASLCSYPNQSHLLARQRGAESRWHYKFRGQFPVDIIHVTCDAASFLSNHGRCPEVNPGALFVKACNPTPLKQSLWYRKTHSAHKYRLHFSFFFLFKKDSLIQGSTKNPSVDLRCGQQNQWHFALYLVHDQSQFQLRLEMISRVSSYVSVRPITSCGAYWTRPVTFCEESLARPVSFCPAPSAKPTFHDATFKVQRILLCTWRKLERKMWLVMPATCRTNSALTQWLSVAVFVTVIPAGFTWTLPTATRSEEKVQSKMWLVMPAITQAIRFSAEHCTSVIASHHNMKTSLSVRAALSSVPWNNFPTKTFACSNIDLLCRKLYSTSQCSNHTTRIWHPKTISASVGKCHRCKNTWILSFTGTVKGQHSAAPYLSLWEWLQLGTHKHTRSVCRSVAFSSPSPITFPPSKLIGSTHQDEGPQMSFFRK